MRQFRCRSARQLFEVFTLLPMLSGEGCGHHGEILRQAGRLAEAGKLVPRVDARRRSQRDIDEAYRILKSGEAAGKLVVDIINGNGRGA